MLFSLLLVAASISLYRYKGRTISSRCPQLRGSSSAYSLWGFSQVYYILFLVFPLSSFSFVEFFSQVDDFHKSLSSQMLSRIYNSRDLFEQREVFGFRFGLKRKPFEERKYLFYDLDVVRHDKIMNSITSFLQSSTLQIFLQKLQICDIALRYIEGKYYLPLEFMVRSLTERNIKASFPITKPRQVPSNIWRCGHTSNYSTCFESLSCWLPALQDCHCSFGQYLKILGVSSIWPNFLTTIIL